MSNGAVPEPEGSWTPGVPHGGQPAGAWHGAAALPLEPPTPTAQARPAPAPSGPGVQPARWLPTARTALDTGPGRWAEGGVLGAPSA